MDLFIHRFTSSTKTKQKKCPLALKTAFVSNDMIVCAMDAIILEHDKSPSLKLLLQVATAN